MRKFLLGLITDYPTKSFSSGKTYKPTGLTVPTAKAPPNMSDPINQTKDDITAMRLNNVHTNY